MIEILWQGGAAIKIKTKDQTIILNPVDPAGANLLIFTREVKNFTAAEDQFVIDSPGEYEVKGNMVYSLISQNGVIARANQMIVDDIFLFYCDNFDFVPTKDQLDDMGTIDIAFIPVSAEKELEKKALKLIEAIEPRVIIPIIADKDTAEGVCLDLAKKLGLKCEAPVGSYKLKSRAQLPEETQEYVALEKKV